MNWNKKEMCMDKSFVVNTSVFHKNEIFPFDFMEFRVGTLHFIIRCFTLLDYWFIILDWQCESSFMWKVYFVLLDHDLFLFCFILFWAFLKTCDFRLNAVPCLMLVWSWSVSPQWIFCRHKINFCFLFLLVWRGWLIVMVGILCSVLCFQTFHWMKSQQKSTKACRCECQQWFWFCQGW